MLRQRHVQKQFIHDSQSDVGYPWDPSTKEVEARGTQILGQPGLKGRQALVLKQKQKEKTGVIYN